MKYCTEHVPKEDSRDILAKVWIQRQCGSAKIKRQTLLQHKASTENRNGKKRVLNGKDSSPTEII